MPSPAPAVTAMLSRSEIVSIMGGLMLAQFIGALDQTIVAPAMPTIGRELGDAQTLPWVVTSYLLVSTAVTPLYGKLSDIHGRRVMLMIAIGTFVLGSIACALAPTMLLLVLARGLQGLGGGGLIALTQTIVGDIIPPKQRGNYQAYIQTTWLAAGLGGPIVGGLFAEYLHWSMIFWINLPLGLVAFLMTSSKLKRLPRHERPHELDLLGAALMMSMSVLLMLALNWGGVRYAWGSSTILSLFAASAVLFAALVLRLRRAREPLIPISVLRNKIVLNGTLAVCFAMSALMGLIIYLPIYFETVLHLGADKSGFALLPLVVGTTTGAGIAGRLMSRMEHYKRVPMVGLSIAIVATSIIAIGGHSLPFALFELLLAALAIGLGSLLPVATVSLQNSVPKHELGTTMALLNFLRQLGSAFAVAAFGTILIGMTTGSGAGGAHELLLKQATENIDGLATGFRILFLISAAALMVSMAFLLRMEEKPLRDARPAAAVAE
ncbi:MAG: transporter [Hyphomicrobiales bacterium]|nr:transporter [Hyphomicrobiales bacterium]